jgi:hypothetical protein
VCIVHFDYTCKYGNTLAVTPVSMRKVISVSIPLSRYYCILKGIAVLNMITPGSDFLCVLCILDIHVSNERTLAVTPVKYCSFVYT